jgi:hypothetical protein
MKTDIFLFIILTLFMHFIRYFELYMYTTIRNFKDYINLNSKVFYVIIINQIIIFVVFELFKLTT